MKLSGKSSPNITPFPETLIELNTPDFEVSERKYAPEMHIARHAHETVVASFAVQGSFIESNSFSQYTCRQGGLSINPAGEVHSSRYSREGSICLVISPPAVSRGVTQWAAKSLPRPIYARDTLLTALAIRIQREIKVTDAVTPLLVQGLVLELFALASREAIYARGGYGRAPGWLQRVIDYLHANFDQGIQLDELSEVAGVHRTTLCRMFRRHYRRSVGEYVRELRLEKSMKDLTDREMSLADVAHSAGFYDQSHFANAFKRHTGLTPSEFRRK